MTTISERTQFPQVLLIEDNRGDAILIRMAFKKAKIPGNVTVAGTAEIGLRILHQQGEYANIPCPDIILLDLNLPYMGGCAFLKLIKADAHLKLIPVIVLSSSSAENDIMENYKGFANGFVTKPFGLDDYDDVVSIIEDYWFRLVQTPPTHDTDHHVWNAAGQTGGPLVA